MDWALIISSVLNLVLVLACTLLAKRGMDLGRMLNGAHRKVQLLQAFIADFVTAYQDKVVTREEARKLMADVRKLIEDP